MSENLRINNSEKEIHDEASIWSKNAEFEWKKISMHILTKIGFWLTLFGIFTYASLFISYKFINDFGIIYLLWFISLIIGPIVSIIWEKKIYTPSILSGFIYIMTRITLILAVLLFIRFIYALLTWALIPYR